MSESSTSLLTTLDDSRDTHNTIMVACAGFTVLVWDHFITFDDEVDLIWKRDKSLLSYLFLLNRYLTPLGFIINLVAYTLPGFGVETCQHFVRYEGAMTVIGIQIAGCIMFFRVRALYNRARIVIWSIILLFLIWLGVNAWLLAKGEAVPHTPGVHSCTMIFDASPRVASASAWLPLLYDTCIFALILYKTKSRSGYLVRTLLSNGIQYYSILCMVNTVLTIMIVQAGPGVKNIAAQFELLLTVAMVSRITLNLRKQVSEDTVFVMSSDWTSLEPTRTMRTRSNTAGTRSRGNSVASAMPRKNSIAFRSVPVSSLEHTRLSVRYTPSTQPDISASMTRAKPALVGKVEGDVEVV